MPAPKDPEKYEEWIKHLSKSHEGQRPVNLGIDIGVKGKIPWNKGLMGYMGANSGSFKKDHIPPLKGKHHKPESNEKNRIAHLGGIPWNKGKTGVYSEETRKQISRNVKQLWKNPTYREQVTMKLRENWKDEERAKDWGRRQNRRPSNPELFLTNVLDKHFPNEWKYVGDCKFWIDGKNPDFININGKKAIIEYNGYWRHTKQKDEAKTKHYEQYGFKTLNLYKIDLKNENNLIETISKFLEVVG